MKITTEKTTIEANAEELRQSNSFSDSFVQLLRSCFNRYAHQEEEDEEEAGEQDETD